MWPPPHVYCKHVCNATEGRLCARMTTTTTTSLCVNKQQTSNSRFHFGMIAKLPLLHTELIAHMFSMLSKHRKLKCFTALQNSHRWGPFKRIKHYHFLFVSSLTLRNPVSSFVNTSSPRFNVFHLASFSLSFLSFWPLPSSSIFFQLLKRHFPTPTHSLQTCL